MNASFDDVVEGASSTNSVPFVTITRGSLAQLLHAELLLNEYYESIGVVRRDSPEEVATYLADESSGFWIAYLEGVTAGCVVLRPLALFDHAAECKRLYVRPQSRGRGIASALLGAMEEYARACGFKWIYLDSKDDLRDALRLYSQRGYVTCERYNDNPQATIFMQKKLVD